MNVRIGFVAWGLAIGLAAVACGSSDGNGGGGSGGGAAATCADDPFLCPAGQTCWPTSTAGTFACLDSAAGVAVGSTCSNIVGQPSCGDGQLCFQQSSATPGYCAAYCSPTDPAHACAAGSACATITLGSGQTHACISTNGAAGAGGGAGSDGGDEGSAGSGGSDAGSDAGSQGSAGSGANDGDAATD